MKNIIENKTKVFLLFYFIRQLKTNVTTKTNRKVKKIINFLNILYFL